MAFFGLLLFITCVLFPYLKLDDNNKEINEIRRNLLVLNHERDAMVNDIKLIEEAEIVNLNDSVISSDPRMLNGKIAEIRKGVDLRTEQISLENKILADQFEKQNDIKYFMGYFVIFSIIISLSGFVLWYLRIQRPLNRFIKLEFLKQVNQE